MKNFEIGAIVLGLVAGTVQAEPVQWAVADGGNGHWYEGVSAPGITWENASILADALGGYLCTVPNEQENLWVFKNVASDPSLWNTWFGPFIGGYQDYEADDYSEPAGGWTWVTGETWGYTSWTPGDPSNTGSQDHLAYGGTSSNHIQPKWNDIEDPEAGGYVIEWDHDPSITQWRIEDGGNGHWYEGVRIGFYPESPGASWDWCKEQAELAGGYLATITSYEEDEWVKATIIVPMEPKNLEAGPQIGGQLIDGQWQWITGEPWDYEAWCGPEPSGDGDRLEYWRWGSLCWNDRLDTWDLSMNTYVIEYTTLPGSALGACCLDGLCITTAAADCSGNSGSWGGPDSSCADFDCPENCPADLDGDGIVKVQDLLILIASWGVCP